MERLTLKSGHIMVLTVAPFEIALDLFQVICRELKAAGVDISGLDLKALGSVDVNEIKDGILHLLGSVEFRRKVFDALRVCTLEKVGSQPQGITSATFEPADMRPDFFLCAWEVIKANVGPLFAEIIDLKSLIPANAKGSASLK